jgi:primary-amine oxidase
VSTVAPAASHPLDPLTADEIRTAVAVVSEAQDLGDDARFSLITLREPDKRAVLAFRGGDPVDRDAFIVVLDRSGATYEAVVSVRSEKMRSWRLVPGVQPSLMLEEIFLVGDIVKASPQWRDAMARRGVTELDQVQVDPWSAGNFGIEAEQGRRLVRAAAHLRKRPTDNGWAHPVEGVVALVDLIAEGDVVPIPSASGNFDAEACGPVRTNLRPLEIVQSEGPSFEILGNEVRWQRWRLRVSLHPTEGLVLHTVGYEDGGRLRSILYRASLSDMVVPYGDPSSGQFYKNAFDAGEYGIGKLVTSLEQGCDCLGEIRYLDAEMANGSGEPYTVANAICIHEEDYGILWKHVDMFSDTSEVRRSRRLVISSVATAGPYDYGFFWYLYQDGSLQLEVKLTGIMETGALEPGRSSQHGTTIGPKLYAPYHQHIFCFRLDLDIDGMSNSVFEVDMRPEPLGPGNPYGNAWRAVPTLLRRESEAQRLTDASAARTWKVVNPDVLNEFGDPVGYRLVPGPTATMLADPSSSVARRAVFGSKHLWVTPYAPDELHAAGDYPNQHPGGDGLPRWTLADRPLEREDVVIWHTFAVTHDPRPEDWPVMPVEYAGFSLKPVGFFARNPALDVPLPGGHHNHGH